MKLGLDSNCRKDLQFSDFLRYAAALGVETVELACGEESGFAHCKPEILLADSVAFDTFTRALEEQKIGVSALSCHGNPVAADKELARRSNESMRNAVLLAEKMGVDMIHCYSGCPGGSPQSLKANWVTVGWPMDYAEVYNWQWNDVLVPYWQDFVQFARQHKVKYIALELHPGQMCFNPKTLQRLRKAAGDEIGASLDFSHLLWQGMKPEYVIPELSGMIWHVLVKDIVCNEEAVRQNGLISLHSEAQLQTKPWHFRSLGYGHDIGYWARIFGLLHEHGFCRTASVTYECNVTSAAFGIKNAVEKLASVLLRDDDCR